MTTQPQVATTQVPQPIPRLLGETYGFWCQTLVLLAAAIFAYVSIRNSRAIERKKAAIHAIFEGRKNQQLVDSVAHIAVLHRSDKSMAVWARGTDEDSKQKARTIRYALNHYEYVGVAISQGIFDEAIYKNSMYTTIVKLYERTKPFIDETRTARGRNTIWQEFECLAVRWKNEPLQAKTIRAVEDKKWWQSIFS